MSRTEPGEGHGRGRAPSGEAEGVPGRGRRGRQDVRHAR
jgi:hypothetical protein